MRALALVEPRHFEFVEIDEPVCGEEEVLIAPRYVGCCGTDMSSYRGTMTMTNYPAIMGHEVSGVIVQAGKKVPARLPVGANVTVLPYANCGMCPACRVGRPNACEFNQTMGVQRSGAMTECLAVHFSKVYTSPSLSLQELALVEPLGVGYQAANRGGVMETDTVLVLGCGGVGLGMVAAAARKGATVIGLDIEDAKLAQAQKFGAQHTINSRTQDAKAIVAELTHGEGVNVALEAAGAPNTSQWALEWTAYAGRVVLIGYAKEAIALYTPLIVRKELDVRGSRNSLNVFPAVIKMLEAHERPFTSMISTQVALPEVPNTFAEWDAVPQKFSKIMVKLVDEQNTL